MLYVSLKLFEAPLEIYGVKKNLPGGEIMLAKGA